MTKSPDLKRLHGAISVCATMLVLLLCVWLSWVAIRDGDARLLAAFARATNSTEAAGEAIRLSPGDPETHYAGAIVSLTLDDVPDAARRLETAIALRPQDYFLWLELGRARQQAGDAKGALTAFRESARLAPWYARPRWELGNLLLRGGQLDESFAELRAAAMNDPALLPAVCDLIWQASARDAQKVVDVIGPATSAERLSIARFFAGRGFAARSVELFLKARDVPDELRRALLNDLLNAGEFAAAYAVWSNGRKSTTVGRSGVIYDGGFEEELAPDEPGFAWHAYSNFRIAEVARDGYKPFQGEYSLLVNWLGGEDTSHAVITQLIPVEPGMRYSLRFAGRAEGLVSAALPVMTVSEAGGRAELARSQSISAKGEGWQEYTLAFDAPPRAGAVLLALRRENCTANPCPIFGKMWLDDFSLEKVR
jgi:hypothetical protein